MEEAKIHSNSDSSGSGNMAHRLDAMISSANQKKETIETAIGEGDIDFDDYITQMKQDLQQDARLALFFRKAGRMDDCRRIFGRHKVLKDAIDSMPSPGDEEDEEEEQTQPPPAPQPSAQGEQEPVPAPSASASVRASTTPVPVVPSGDEQV